MGLNIWRERAGIRQSWWLLVSQNTGKVTNGHYKSQISDALGMRPNNPGNDEWNTVILNILSELNLILFKGDSVTIVSYLHSAWMRFSEYTHTHTHTGVAWSLPFHSHLLCSPERLRPRSRWSDSVCGLHLSSAWQQHVGKRTCCICSGVCHLVYCVNPDTTRSFADCLSVVTDWGPSPKDQNMHRAECFPASYLVTVGKDQPDREIFYWI